MIGRDLMPEEILAEVMKDKPFYDNSGGGVTVSGGEPAMQEEFLLDLIALLKEQKLHVTLETSGFCDFKLFESLLPHVDLFLYDYKETDPGLHRKYTGVPNTLILENLEKLSAAGAKIVLRCPIIPSLNDREDHFRGIAAVSIKYRNIEGAELLPYHNLAKSKAGRMNLDVRKHYSQPARDTTDRWANIVRNYGGKIIDSY
jgi:pyruvate formate lyase activating enzyme